MCEYCEGWKEHATFYQTGRYCDLYIGKFLGHPGLGVGNLRKGCPPYADCSAKNWAPNQVFAINYCPECGEKLENDAEMEQKNGGCNG